MKILLVDPPVQHIGAYIPYKTGPAFALGLLSIDAYIRKNGYENNELEHYFNCDWNAIEERLKASNPDVIGISCTTDSRGFCWKLSRLAKSFNPNVKIVFGNVHASFFPSEILAYHECVDFCVIYEGEVTFLELLRAFEAGQTDFSNIPGLAWRNPSTGKPQINESRALVKDLDDFPMNPRRRIFINEVGKRQANMLSSRGCPFTCAFCSSAHFWHQSWRKNSVDRVIEEFEWLVSQGVEVIDMYDDLFTVDIRRAEAICDKLIERGNKTPWFARARVGVVTEQLVDKMIAAKCTEISFGVESGDPDILATIDKRISITKTEEIFDMLRPKKVTARANFIIGHPNDTPESIEATVRFSKRLNPTNINVAIARVYPRTNLDEAAQKHGLISRDYWYKDTGLVPYYTVDFTFEDLQAYSTRMMFLWASARGPIHMAKVFIYNLQVGGMKRSFSFIWSWIGNVLFGKKMGQKVMKWLAKRVFGTVTDSVGAPRIPEIAGTAATPMYMEPSHTKFL